MSKKILSFPDKSLILPDWTSSYQNIIRKWILSYKIDYKEVEKDHVDYIQWDLLHKYKNSNIPAIYVIANDQNLGVFTHLDAGVFSLSEVSSEMKTEIYYYFFKEFTTAVAPFGHAINFKGDLVVNFVSPLKNIKPDYYLYLISEIHSYAKHVQDELATKFG